MNPATIYVVGLRGFPHVQGGIEKHCEELYPRIVKEGKFKVVVLCRSNHQPREFQEFHGVIMRSLWSPSSAGYEAFAHTLLGVLYAIMKRPDILHIHAIGPGFFTLLARLFGLKVVFTHHGFDYRREKWGFIPRAILSSGEYLAMKFSNAVIAVSEVAATELRMRYRREVHTIRNAVNIHKNNNETNILKHLGVCKKEYILSVSRIVEEKRQLDIVNAYLEMTNSKLKLLIVGGSSGSDYFDLVKEKIGNNKNVILAGLVYGDELNDLYRNCQLFIHASSLEGNPIVVLEAMSFGVPILVSDIDAHREISLDESEYFSLGNISDMKDKINSILSCERNVPDQEKIEYIRREYSWDAVFKKTVHIYESISCVV